MSGKGDDLDEIFGVSATPEEGPSEAQEEAAAAAAEPEEPVSEENAPVVEVAAGEEVDPFAIASESATEPLMTEPDVKDEPPKKEEAKAQPAKAAEPQAPLAVEDPFAELVTPATEGAPAAVPPSVQEAVQQQTSVNKQKGRMDQRDQVQDTVLPTLPVNDNDFDYSDAEAVGGYAFLYYGEKGGSKTATGLSHVLLGADIDDKPEHKGFGSDTLFALSFDRQTLKIRDNYYNPKNDDGKPKYPQGPDIANRIVVKDAIRYLYKTSPQAWLESAAVSYRYVNALLIREALKMKPDWIMLDGIEIFVREICEMTLRARNNFGAFQGFDLTYWKERNMLVDAVFDLCLKIAKKGVILTAYVDTKAIKMENGRITEAKREPKWAASMKYQVGNVIYVSGESQQDADRLFYAYVDSAKEFGLRTGVRADITSDVNKGVFKGIREIVQASKGLQVESV